MQFFAPKIIKISVKNHQTDCYFRPCSDVVPSTTISEKPQRFGFSCCRVNCGTIFHPYIARILAILNSN